jgi:hypothetical protein
MLEVALDVREAGVVEFLLDRHAMALWELLRRAGAPITVAQLSRQSGSSQAIVQEAMDALVAFRLAKRMPAAGRRKTISYQATCERIVVRGDLADPQRFITATSDTCTQLISSFDRLNAKLDAWYRTDFNIPASQRNAADTVLWDMAAREYGRAAEEREQLGRSSANPVAEDFLVMSAQYLRAYVAAIPTYIPADHQLYQVARYLGGAMNSACSAVQR